MTPAEYHLAGLAMVMIALLIGRFGPEELRGWPAGIRTPRGRAAALVFVALVWPPVVFVYAVGGAVLTLQKLWETNVIEWTVRAVFAVVALAMAVGAVYWLLFQGVPLLLRWYGIAGS